ncbi:hypothetical protein LINGRAHAP2_LOCUS30754 [Linum grandiflorum]
MFGSRFEWMWRRQIESAQNMLVLVSNLIFPNPYRGSMSSATLNLKLFMKAWRIYVWIVVYMTTCRVIAKRRIPPWMQQLRPMFPRLQSQLMQTIEVLG